MVFGCWQDGDVGFPVLFRSLFLLHLAHSFPLKLLREGCSVWFKELWWELVLKCDGYQKQCTDATPQREPAGEELGVTNQLVVGGDQMRLAFSLIPRLTMAAKSEHLNLVNIIRASLYKRFYVVSVLMRTVRSWDCKRLGRSFIYWCTLLEDVWT